jgi:8-oxo-dGTP pyrophosphatase MutT (NUDIX family)
LREIKEEIGLDVSSQELKKIGRVAQQGVLNNGTYLDNEFDNVYLVIKDIGLDEFKFLDGEVEKLEWMPISEFKQWVQDKKPDLVPHSIEHALLLKALESL